MGKHEVKGVTKRERIALLAVGLVELENLTPLASFTDRCAEMARRIHLLLVTDRSTIRAARTNK